MLLRLWNINLSVQYIMNNCGKLIQQFRVFYSIMANHSFCPARQQFSFSFYSVILIVFFFFVCKKMIYDFFKFIRFLGKNPYYSLFVIPKITSYLHFPRISVGIFYVCVWARLEKNKQSQQTNKHLFVILFTNSHVDWTNLYSP